MPSTESPDSYLCKPLDDLKLLFGKDAREYQISSILWYFWVIIIFIFLIVLIRNKKVSNSLFMSVLEAQAGTRRPFLSLLSTETPSNTPTYSPFLYLLPSKGTGQKYFRTVLYCTITTTSLAKAVSQASENTGQRL